MNRKPVADDAARPVRFAVGRSTTPRDPLMRPLPQPRLSRRQCLQVAASGALALALPARAASQAKQPPAAPTPLNRFPRMVQEWYVEQVRAATQIGLDAQAKLKTKADAEAYVRDVRGKIAKCFGAFPEKTPLNAKVTGKIDRDAYTIEKVIFESR